MSSFAAFKTIFPQCTELTQDFLEEIFYNLKQLLGKYDGTKICGLVHLCKSGEFRIGFPSSLCLFFVVSIAGNCLFLPEIDSDFPPNLSDHMTH